MHHLLVYETSLLRWSDLESANASGAKLWLRCMQITSFDEKKKIYIIPGIFKTLLPFFI